MSEGDDTAVFQTSPHILTGQQQAIIEQIVAGRNLTEAAEALSIGRETAKHHMDRIRTKLKARTIAQAAAIAVELGLVMVEIG